MASVSRAGPQRYLVAAGPERIADVTSWFARSGLELAGVTVAGTSLEDVFLALTTPPEQRP